MLPLRNRVAALVVAAGAALLPITASAQEPAPDVCALYSAEEVRVVLEAPPSGAPRELMPGMCTWSAPGKSLSVFATRLEQPAEAIQLVEQTRTSTSAPALAREEPGLGQRAVSVIGSNGRSLDLYVANGRTMWRFTLETGDQRTNVDAALPRLRSMAAKAIKS